MIKKTLEKFIEVKYVFDWLVEWKKKHKYKIFIIEFSLSHGNSFRTKTEVIVRQDYVYWWKDELIIILLKNNELDETAKTRNFWSISDKTKYIEDKIFNFPFELIF